FEGEVVALGGAAGEDELAGAGPEELGDLAAGLLDRLRSALAEDVRSAGSIAVLLGEERQHRLEHARIDAGGRVVVQVDGRRDHLRMIGRGRRAIKIGGGDRAGRYSSRRNYAADTERAGFSGDRPRTDPGSDHD